MDSTKQKRHGGPPRTGSIAYKPGRDGAQGRYVARVPVEVRQPDGSIITKRSRFYGKPSPKSKQAEARFRESVAAMIERGEVFEEKAPKATSTLNRGAAAPAGVETVTAWWKRYHEAAALGTVGRKNKGQPQATVRDRRDRFRTYIEPEIGNLVMRDVKPEDVHKVVLRLDALVRERAAYYERVDETEAPKGKKAGLAGKTAAHVWSELRSGFKQACTLGAFKVRDDDPTERVPPPVGGQAREQAALYPNELEALLACPDVPRWRRELYAVAAYTGMRQGELRALLVGDVDEVHGIIRITRQKSANAAAARRTKTSAGVREVPIHVHVAPLFRRLVEGREAGEHVLRVPNMADAPDKLRVDMKAAKLTRPELWANDAHRQPFNFHGLRHTCLTHWAMTPGATAWSLMAAGHTDLATSQRYIATANLLRAGRFGEPHPALPASLVAAQSGETVAPVGPTSDPISTRPGHTDRDTEGRFKRNLRANVAIPAGIEPEGRNAIDGDARPIDEVGEGGGNATDERQVPDRSSRWPELARSSDAAETASAGALDAHPAPPVDVVEVALATALEKATAAGDLTLMGQLGRELEARRVAREEIARAGSNVRRIETARSKRGAS